jgi:nucleoid-associated protein YgaU
MPSPAPASAEPAGAPAGREAAPAKPAGPLQATTTYVVKPGDSLWKIFTSVRSEKPDRGGWIDFLSNAQSMNSLNDPDLLKPGKVLTISVQK